MKRLTISMSDELFDRLDEIENKSLFVRDIIERELSSETVDVNEGLADRLGKVEIQLESIQSMLQSMPPIGEIKKMVLPVEAKPIERVMSEPEIAIPESIPTEEIVPEPEVTMPGLAPTEEVVPEPEVAMPELRLAKETQQQPSSPPLPAFETPSPANAPTSIPSASQQPVGKPDKLEGNILMYMPHGAENKRSIIKSLLSKRYEPDEIDGKINQLISAGTLSTTTKDGVDYLKRV